MSRVKTDRKYMSRRDVVEQDVHVREINSSRISLSSPFVFPRFAAKPTLYTYTSLSQSVYVPCITLSVIWSITLGWLWQIMRFNSPTWLIIDLAKCRSYLLKSRASGFALIAHTDFARVLVISAARCATD